MATQRNTLGEQLTEVETAISSVHSSQRYEINGRTVQRADLEWLHKERIYLIGEIAKFGIDFRIGTPQVNRGTMKVSFENE